MAEKYLYKGASTLNTVLDPERLSTGSQEKPNIIELAQAVNVSIDDNFLVTLRNGDTLAQSGSFHSGFCGESGPGLMISETASWASIVYVSSVTPFITAGIRSGLTKNKYMSWAEVNDVVFYANGFDNGYIKNNVSSAWPSGNYTGPDSNYDYLTTAPVANLLAYRGGGIMALVCGDTVWFNMEPFEFGLFNKARGFIRLDSTITMIAAVDSGYFISDSKRTWFFRGTSWHDLEQPRVVEFKPALKQSLAHNKILLSDLGMDAGGYGRIWVSKDGVCLGTDSGGFINLTREQVKYPQAYSYAACLVANGKIINTVF